MALVLPEIKDNSDGWGPVSPPAQFEGLPYLPFSKSDKLSKVADWNTAGQFPNRYNSRYQTEVQSVFSFSSTDDGSFTLIDNQKQQPKFRQRKFANQYTRVIRNVNQTPQNRNAKQQTAAGARQNQTRTGKKWKQTATRSYYRGFNDKRTFEPSIQVQLDWQFVQHFDLKALQKLSFPPTEAEDFVAVGEVKPLDTKFLLVNPRNEKLLRNHEAAFFNKTASDDPIIKNIAASGEANVFGTDSLVALLMTASKTVYPWDIVINRVGDKLFYDKREGSKIDLLTVGETSVDPPSNEKDSNINSAMALSKEATLIDQYFARQIVDESQESISLLKNESLIPDDFQVGTSNRGYRYRLWRLSEKVKLLVRCDVNVVEQSKNGTLKYISVNALNEYDPKVNGIDWRQKLDNQQGAVFATELKNNAAKLARWAAQATVSGSEQLLIGYVSRLSPKDQNSHAILKVQPLKTSELHKQEICNPAENMFGVIKALSENLLELEEGKYILMRDPNEPVLALYRVPQIESAPISEDA